MVKTAILGARASKAGPNVAKTEDQSIARSRPERAVRGPAERAPTRPPRVKEEVISPNCEGVVGMHCGSDAREVGSRLLRAQVMTSEGAFSSARW